MDNIKKLLGNADLEMFYQIVANNKKIAGTHPPNFNNFSNLYEKYFIENAEYQMFGYVRNNLIISVVGVAYKENNSRGRFWVISSFFSAIKSNLFSFNKPEIGLLIKKAFENSERLNYFEYYYAIAEHVSEVYERQIDKNIYIPLKRYNRITLDIIPKNTLPNSDHLYNKLLGNEPKPHNMIVKKRVLKDEYRK